MIGDSVFMSKMHDAASFCQGTYYKAITGEVCGQYSIIIHQAQYGAACVSTASFLSEGPDSEDTFKLHFWQ